MDIITEKIEELEKNIEIYKLKIIDLNKEIDKRILKKEVLETVNLKRKIKKNLITELNTVNLKRKIKDYESIIKEYEKFKVMFTILKSNEDKIENLTNIIENLTTLVKKIMVDVK